MKLRTIMVVLLALTVSGGSFHVKAAQAADPWKMIGEEVLHEECTMTEQWFPGHFRGDEGSCPEMWKGPVQGLTGKMPGPDRMYPPPDRPADENRLPREMMPHDRLPGCFMKFLDLTDAQKKQIFSIVLDQREKTSSLVKKRTDLHMQLRKEEQAPSFNEKAIRTITARLADNEADLVVSRVNARSRISAVLTPSQRDLVKKMQTGAEPLPYPPPYSGVSE
jgi:Spy/CpxP family protein refolding chaperone